MKRYTSLIFSLLCLSFIFTPRLFSQDPDAWEANQTSYQPPETVLEAIDLKEGMTVGEIGAGRGRYSVILAEAVGKNGLIYANDIDKEDLDYLDLRCERDGITNITIIRGKELDPLLQENELDMIFIVNSYHHFSKPVELLQNAQPALKASGTLVIIEGVPGRYGRGSTHATPKENLISQVEQAGYSFDRVAAELTRDNIYIFKKL
ncbi:MAG: methyltransferase domain-containing protein [Bacteroidetes bacterium]|nr:methyltransferase domain-containing protein [Bacteroidota bacterium]